MDSQGLQFIGPIVTEYEPCSDLSVERTGPRALNPANPVNDQVVSLHLQSSASHFTNVANSAGELLPL